MINCDILDSKLFKKAAEATIKRFWHIHILINKTAFQLHAEASYNLDPIIRTNLYVTYNMALAGVPHIEAWVAIINTGSSTELTRGILHEEYCMKKGRYSSLTKALVGNMLAKCIRLN